MKHSPFVNHSTKRAFTLMEMIIVLGIISILVGVSVTMLGGVFGDAEEVEAKTKLKTLRAFVFRYKVKGGVYPSEQQGLEALVTRPQSQPQPGSWKQMLTKEEIVDPWGSPYQYKHPGVRSTVDFDIFSFGPDKVANTEDDIYSN